MKLLAGVQLHPTTFKEWQLSIRITDSVKLHFGLGLMSALAIAPVAYLVSLAVSKTQSTHSIRIPDAFDDDDDVLVDNWVYQACRDINYN